MRINSAEFLAPSPQSQPPALCVREGCVLVDFIERLADEAMNFKLQLNPEVLRQFTTAGAKVRHNAIRGLFPGATPTLRAALEHMNSQPAVPNPEGVGPLHFHRSVLRHLEEHAVQVGSSWPNRVSAEMGKIGDLAVRAYVVNQLLGTLSVGNASRTALNPGKYA